MNLIISNSDGRPIYEQISSQIREKIISGELSEGDSLPSMRMLAKELRISVITTKRAYDELERDGFITTVTGKGSFVAAKNIEMIREEYLRRIEIHLQTAADLAMGCGLGHEELCKMLVVFYEEG